MYFLQIMEICIPSGKVKVRRNLPWINKEVLDAIRKRNTLFRFAKRSGKPSDFAKYKAKRNEVVFILRKSKQSFFNQNLNNADTKTFWKTVRLLNGSSSSIPTLLDVANSASMESSSAKADCLNKYFYTCFNHNHPPLTTLDNDLDLIYGSLCPQNCPVELLCTEEAVLELLVGLDISKSCGNDGISPRMLKSTSFSITSSLCRLFNLSISTGQFPSAWKLGRITPIPKGSNKTLPSGYRPISVLPVVSKLIERHVKAVLETYLLTNAPISEKQWGFMCGRSTVSALIRVVDDWQRALDQGNEVCAVFFDISKAFDTVPHLPLLHTLIEIGIDPYLIRWIYSYLAGRSQFVCVDGCISNKLSVLSGVPQGSVLGPLLFICYINDIATAISSDSEINMFADDIALYRVIKTRMDYVHLQNDINSISSCLEQKHLRFNATKCKIMFISRKRVNSLSPPPLELNGTILDSVSSYKYLGVTLTSDLSWSLHITNCCNTTRRLIGLLYRQFYQHTSPPCLLRLYKSFIRPHLEYASVVWNPYYRGEIAALESVQKFALRVCLKLWDTNYDELLSAADIPSLQHRRIQQSLCHLFKIINGLIDFPSAPTLPRVSLYGTRSAGKPVFLIPKFRTSSYHFSFFPNALSFWNSLPRDIFDCHSFFSFKRSVLHHL